MRVYYDMVASPIGELVIVTTQWGVRWVTFASERPRILGDDAMRDCGAVSFVKEQLEEYWEGARFQFELPIAWELLPGFQGRVLRALSEVKYGETISYGELAIRAHSPNAARAVGQSCGLNPLLLLVPCHRVVAAGGSLGGFQGGTEMKAALLAREGVVLSLAA